MRLLSLLTFTISAFPYYAYSYCVYNKHNDDTSINVSQAPIRVGYASRTFHKDIPPGGKECCPYTNSDCNIHAGDADYTVKLLITHHRKNEIFGNFTVTLPAGGWVEVHGDTASHDITVKRPDGRNYDETKIVFGGSLV